MRTGRSIRRRTGVGVAIAAISWAVIAGCTDRAVDDTGRSSGTAPATAAVPSHAATTLPPSRAATTIALARLATVPVKGRAPMTGYDRAEFGQAWTDDTTDLYGHNGCDTRNDVLRRDLVDITLKPRTRGCVVLSGTLRDPYTGTTIHFVRGEGTSLAVQIDHVVPLGDAWQTGAQGWSMQKRTDLANDPLELLAVDGPTNESKGDGDAATWLPPDHAFRCLYVARQVAVKARYGLWMTSAEHAASERVLRRCPRRDAQPVR